MKKLQAIGVGPVVQRDELTNRAELASLNRTDDFEELRPLAPR